MVQTRPDGDLSDSELIQAIRDGELGQSSDEKLVQEALARIIIAFKERGIEAGGFVYFGDSSFGLNNCDDYKHLGKIHDYGLRFSQAVINGDDNQEEGE